MHNSNDRQNQEIVANSETRKKQMTNLDGGEAETVAKRKQEN